MKSLLASLALCALSSTALALPPAGPSLPLSGHPAPAPGAGHPTTAVPSNTAPAPLTKKAKVVSVLDAKQFTYIEIQEGGKSQWLVSPVVAVKPGNNISYAAGEVMAKFHSNILSRDFSNVVMTTRVVVDK